MGHADISFQEVNMKIETKCLHAGYTPKNTEPRVVPIVQSTTYVYDSTDDVAAVFDDPTKSLIYSRFENPTVMAVEEKINALEARYRCYVYIKRSGRFTALASQHFTGRRQLYLNCNYLRRHYQPFCFYSEKAGHRVYFR